jgi:transposase-like protein
MPVTRVRYSEAFKRQIVDEVERGKHGSFNRVAHVYGIGCMATVSRWTRQYGREDLLPKNVRVETLNERDELKEARKRIRELEAAVADAHVDYCLEKAYLRVACDWMETDPDSFKKKHALKLSDTRKSKLTG